MSVNLHTGYPGSGKSHALVKDVIVPGVLAGRRVVSNVDGLNPDAIIGYCAERVDDGGSLGSVVLFHGEEMLKPGFFPDDKTPPGSDTFIKPGDLLVIDEVRLYFPARGKFPEGCNFVPFIRWHRHLTDDRGRSIDVHLATQLATDIHQDVRGTTELSYKYKKLRAVGMDNQFGWYVWQGHLQPKNEYFQNGLGTYDKAIFPLYKSSAAAGTGIQHTELTTNSKGNIWKGWKAKAAIAAMLLLPIAGIVGLWLAYRSMGGAAEVGATHQPPNSVPAGQGVPSGPPAPVRSPYRIVGQVTGAMGTTVIVQDEKGTVRMLEATGFEFDPDGRPLRGLVDGQMAYAAEGLGGSAVSSSMMDRAFQ